MMAEVRAFGEMDGELDLRQRGCVGFVCRPTAITLVDGGLLANLASTSGGFAEAYASRRMAVLIEMGGRFSLMCPPSTPIRWSFGTITFGFSNVLQAL